MRRLLGGGSRPGRGASAPGGPRDPEAGNIRQTLLLATLLEHFEEDQAITVLDVGAGVAETVAFFSRFPCRLRFADLYDASALREPVEDDPEAHYEAIFAELCDFPPGTRFDVCLLWDFLNYLPLPALRAFSAALRPFVSRDTRGHGFGAFKANAPAVARAAPEAPLQFGIQAPDRLAVKPRSGGLTFTYAHSRAVLAEAFPCFEIVRGTLLRDGAMELLLHASH
jgi:hypothetical protein